MNRENQGKAQMHKLHEFGDALLELVNVQMEGAKKYPNVGKMPNWLIPPAHEENSFFDSALRHIHQYLQGQKLDEETGCDHRAHAAWNLLAAMRHYPIAEQK